MNALTTLLIFFAGALVANHDENDRYYVVPGKFYHHGEVLEWQMQGAHLDLSHVKLDKAGRNTLAKCSWIKGVRISNGSDSIDEFLSFVLSIPNLEELEVSNAHLGPEIFLLLPRVKTLKTIKLENVAIKKEDIKKWGALERLALKLKQLTLLGCNGVPDSFLLTLAGLYEHHSNLQAEIGTVDHGHTGEDAKAFLRGNKCLTIHCKEGVFEISPRAREPLPSALHN